MEMGLGIHGESGAETLPVQPVDKIVAQVPLPLTLVGRRTPAQGSIGGIAEADYHVAAKLDCCWEACCARRCSWASLGWKALTRILTSASLLAASRFWTVSPGGAPPGRTSHTWTCAPATLWRC
jgi:hypothetical protein